MILPKIFDAFVFFGMLSDHKRTFLFFLPGDSRQINLCFDSSVIETFQSQPHLPGIMNLMKGEIIFFENPHLTLEF